jgi:hypothetical protein
MPRYFFNVLDGESLKSAGRDREGSVFSDANEARKEAIGLAKDIARHALHGRADWKVVVTDDDGAQVLTVPLSEVRTHKSWIWLKLLGRAVSRHALTVVWLTAGTSMIVQAAVVTMVLLRDMPGTSGTGASYQTSSAAMDGSFVAVRFSREARLADLATFLETYNASLAGGPRPGDLYRLRVAETAVPAPELAKIVSRMAQEKVVEFAAAVQ